MQMRAMVCYVHVYRECRIPVGFPLWTEEMMGKWTLQIGQIGDSTKDKGCNPLLFAISMFGDACCTFIPNNTAPDGSVTRALAGLHTLSAGTKEHSGVSNPFEDAMTRWFGAWKGLITSIFTSIIDIIGILTLCGCCCIPCVRSLSVRLISTVLEGKSPPPYQMTQLSLEAESLLSLSPCCDDLGEGDTPL